MIVLTEFFSEWTVSDNSCREKLAKYGRAGQTTYDSIIRRMRIACWVTKATHTHTLAFPRQQWLRERASALLHTYIVLFLKLVGGSQIRGSIGSRYELHILSLSLTCMSFLRSSERVWNCCQLDTQPGQFSCDKRQRQGIRSVTCERGGSEGCDCGTSLTSQSHGSGNTARCYWVFWKNWTDAACWRDRRERSQGSGNRERHCAWRTWRTHPISPVWNGRLASSWETWADFEFFWGRLLHFLFGVMFRLNFRVYPPCCSVRDCEKSKLIVK